MFLKSQRETANKIRDIHDILLSLMEVTATNSVKINKLENKPKKETQREAVLRELQQRPLTHRTASYDLNIDRLAAHICELRKRGHRIKTVRRKRRDDSGRRAWYAEYFLV